jgi:hypothetical protein
MKGKVHMEKWVVYKLIDCESVGRILLAGDKIQWGGLASKVMKPRNLQNVGGVVTSWKRLSGCEEVSALGGYKALWVSF